MPYKEFVIQYSLGSLSLDTLKQIACESKNKRILNILSKDKDNIIRRNVAYNKNTPKEILNILSKDDDIIVRIYVASR